MISTPPSMSENHRNDAAITRGVLKRPQRVGIYGPGGIGKTTLTAQIAQLGKRLLFCDLDDGSSNLDVSRLRNIRTWEQLLNVIDDPAMWQSTDTLIIDSMTRAQDLCTQWILERDHVTSIELACGGYGRGYRLLYDEMVKLLDSLDRHIIAGRDVVLIMHEFTARVPNPTGEDFLRFEPNLYRSDRFSIRHRVKEWLDHLLFIGYDVFAKDGKASGSGTRTIYPAEMPTHWAKSRKLFQPVPFTLPTDPTIWKQLLGT